MQRQRIASQFFQITTVINLKFINMSFHTTPTPQAAPAKTADKRRTFSLGILNNYPDSEETRLFLTPESCGLLTTMGIDICMENGAGIDINYSDEAYAEKGVKIKTRAEVLASEVLISVRPLNVADTMQMKPDATLFTLYDPSLPREVLQALIDRRVSMIALDHMYSANGVRIFARVLDEIDGRAAMLYAQDGLSFLGDGKGVLMGGVPGLQPCEVLIIGQGCRVHAAAKAALQTGARVTLMNNDIAALHEAVAECGPNLITSAIHPKVLFNDVKRADVIILDNCTRKFMMPEHLSLAMKDNVYVLDLNETVPSLVVPRTVAMAMSNVLINLFSETLMVGGIRRQITSTPGVQAGLVTYRGHLVDKPIATRYGLHALDLGIMITETN